MTGMYHLHMTHRCHAPYIHAPPLPLTQYDSQDVGQPGQHSPGVVTGLTPFGHTGQSQKIISHLRSPPLQVLQGMTKRDTLSLKE